MKKITPDFLEYLAKNGWLVAKVGGSCLKRARDIIYAINTILKLQDQFPDCKIIVVFSALFNVTNELEEIAKSAIAKDPDWNKKINALLDRLDGIFYDFFQQNGRKLHQATTTGRLWSDRKNKFYKVCETQFSGQKLITAPELTALILSEGERLATFFMEVFLSFLELPFPWVRISAKKIIKTNKKFVDSSVLKRKTAKLVRGTFGSEKLKDTKLFITEGFIGTTLDNKNSVMKRETSDYTAALLAEFLDASGLIFYKEAGAIFESLESGKKLTDMTYDQLDLKIKNEPDFKAIQRGVTGCIRKKKIPLLVGSARTGRIGTIVH